jgi:hypothetical protein
MGEGWRIEHRCVFELFGMRGRRAGRGCSSTGHGIFGFLVVELGFLCLLVGCGLVRRFVTRERDIGAGFEELLPELTVCQYLLAQVIVAGSHLGTLPYSLRVLAILFHNR